MCDFAPRQNFDIHAAIRDANIRTAGLYGWPRIRASMPSMEDSSTPAQRLSDRNLSKAGAAAVEKGEG